MKKLHLPQIQIVHAAVNLYAAYGPRGMTMRRIAAAVGLSAPGLYIHFRNKDAILDAVAANADRQLADRLRTPGNSQPPRNRTQAVLGRALEFSVEQPHLFRLAASHRPRWKEPAHAAREVLATELAEAAQQGEIAPGDPARHAVSLWAQICGLAAVRERGDLPADAVPLRAGWFAAARAVLDGLRNPANDPAPGATAEDDSAPRNCAPRVSEDRGWATHTPARASAAAHPG